MRLTFYGGAGEVTGANYILESGDTKIMIDCGLHQGAHFCEKHNWELFRMIRKTECGFSDARP